MVFEDKDLNTLGKAFDRAWDLFLRKGLLTPQNLQESPVHRQTYSGESARRRSRRMEVGARCSPPVLAPLTAVLGGHYAPADDDCRSGAALELRQCFSIDFTPLR
jgi:hypothetical protein